MADRINPLLALCDIDGVPVQVPLCIPGNEGYERAVEEAMGGGHAPRPPTPEELARAIEAWRRQQGRPDGFKKQRVTEFRTFLEPNRDRW